MAAVPHVGHRLRKAAAPLAGVLVVFLVHLLPGAPGNGVAFAGAAVVVTGSDVLCAVVRVNVPFAPVVGVIAVFLAALFADGLLRAGGGAARMILSAEEPVTVIAVDLVLFFGFIFIPKFMTQGFAVIFLAHGTLAGISAPMAAVPYMFPRGFRAADAGALVGFVVHFCPAAVAVRRLVLFCITPGAGVVMHIPVNGPLGFPFVAQGGRIQASFFGIRAAIQRFIRRNRSLENVFAGCFACGRAGLFKVHFLRFARSAAIHLPFAGVVNVCFGICAIDIKPQNLALLPAVVVGVFLTVFLIAYAAGGLAYAGGRAAAVLRFVLLGGAARRFALVPVLALARGPSRIPIVIGFIAIFRFAVCALGFCLAGSRAAGMGFGFLLPAGAFALVVAVVHFRPVFVDVRRFVLFRVTAGAGVIMGVAAVRQGGGPVVEGLDGFFFHGGFGFLIRFQVLFAVLAIVIQVIAAFGAGGLFGGEGFQVCMVFGVYFAVCRVAALAFCFFYAGGRAAEMRFAVAFQRDPSTVAI